uniref:Uncharacterized protein n=1 Tax=Leersia perrieri TaxID=77586 RepID=A0A0D9XZ13_9ORYZ
MGGFVMPLVNSGTTFAPHWTMADDFTEHATGGSSMRAPSPRMSIMDSLFAIDPYVNQHYYTDASPATQLTQPSEQAPDVTPTPEVRFRHPSDPLTYPREQIRQRKKGGPRKWGKQGP